MKLKKILSFLQFNHLLSFLEKTISFFLNRLPTKSLLNIRSDTTITKPLDYTQGSIVIHIDSNIEHRIRTISCQKEPEVIEWIENNFKPGDTFYDIGANIGAYSLVACDYLKGDIKVYAFEPAFMNYAQLCKNIHLNKFSRSIIACQVGLSDHTSIDTFNYASIISGSAAHSLGKSVDFHGKETRPEYTQPMLSYCLDDFVKQFKIPKPNYVKIDVDGIELSILQGASSILKSDCIKSLIVEVDGGRNQGLKITDLLKKYGYALSSKHRYVLAEPSSQYYQCFNYIFKRSHDVPHTI